MSGVADADDFSEYAPDIGLYELKAAVAPKNSDLDEELETVNDKAEQYLQNLDLDEEISPYKREIKDITLLLDGRMIYAPYLDDLNPAGQFFYILFADEEDFDSIDRSDVNYWSPK